MLRSPVVLASASPRRADLLRAAGIPFEVVAADIDERAHPGEDAEVYARRMAEAKARAVRARVPGRPVLAADTVVVVDGEILGKPADRPDATRMLLLLAGRTHEVLTAVNFGANTVVARTVVEFEPLTAAEIEWYVASGEPMDKAGGYGIQGLASRFIARIDGSYTNVVGLPVALVYGLIKGYPEPI